jgi:hypothetical protein
MTLRSVANKIDNNSGLTTNSQIDRSAADAAVFYERLFALRGVDLQWKNFAAMRASDLCLNEKFHFSDE